MVTATRDVRPAGRRDGGRGGHADGGERLSARGLTLGAALQALLAPDRHGRVADIMPGYEDAESDGRSSRHWGQTIGRYRMGDGFALEPPVFADTPGQPTSAPRASRPARPAITA